MLFAHSPLATFDSLRREMNRLLDGYSRPEFSRPRSVPAMNAWQDEDNLYVEAELPGIPLENIDISVERDELSIHARRESDSSNDRTYHRRERVAGEFTRTISLPVPVDADKTEATLNNGILTIVLPKAAEAKPRKIAVKTA